VATSAPIVPGLCSDDWPLRDPKGQLIEEVRMTRDDIRARVQFLITQQGLGVSTNWLPQSLWRNNNVDERASGT